MHTLKFSCTGRISIYSLPLNWDAFITDFGDAHGSGDKTIDRGETIGRGDDGHGNCVNADASEMVSMRFGGVALDKI